MEHRGAGEGMHVTQHVDRVLLPLVVAAALLIPGCRSGDADGLEAADTPAADPHLPAIAHAAPPTPPAPVEWLEEAPGGRAIPADIPADRRARLAVNATRSVTLSAISEDGLSWTLEPGKRLALDHPLSNKMATAPAALPLPDGRIRLYHGGVDMELGDARVLSAISSDGLTFTREDGIRVSNESGYGTDPNVFRNGDQVVLFYVSTGAEFRNRFFDPWIEAAVSADGLTFEPAGEMLRQRGVPRGSPEVFRAGDAWLMLVNGLELFRAADPLGPWQRVAEARLPHGGGASVVETDSGYRLYYTANRGMQHVVRSAVSGDGVNWTVEEGLRLETSDESFGLLNSDVVQLSDGRLRMYLNYMWDADVLDGP
jgi:hypothetical protein